MSRLPENVGVSRNLLIVCGPGGVGKTTLAAALSVHLSVKLAKRVLVLTIDPARRLADALGVGSLSNEVREVDLSQLQGARGKIKGELYASMLDTKSSWDQLVRRYAPDRSTADAILANRLYQNVSGRFVQSHEYIAMERLYDLWRQAEYDVVVVDTPPSRNALDFLDAPARMADFFTSRLLRWLIAPYRSGLFNIASKPFYELADRVLGGQFLRDVSEFFILFQSMYEGFVERARSVEALLRSDATGLFVVCTPEAVPAREAAAFATEATKRGLTLSAVVVNKVLPEALRSKELAACAEALLEFAPRLAGHIEAGGDGEAAVRLVRGVARTFLDYHQLALRQNDVLEQFSEMRPLLVPYQPAEPVSLAHLAALGKLAFG